MLRSLSLLLPGLLLLAGPAEGAPAPLLAASRLERVLVYSSQARVFRAASVTLRADGLTAAVADLPPTADRDSVRVECKTSEVRRVEILATRGELPLQARARELAGKIEASLDRLRALRDERQLLEGELALVGALRLQRQLPHPDKAPPEGLFVDAWRRILAWVEARSSKAQARILVLAGEGHREQRALHALTVESQGQNLAAAGDAVPRVVVTLAGKPGRHAVTVSYLVGGVRWVPAYDLGYDPRSRSVELATYALLSQASGEDWSQAALEFSTGSPAGLIAIPELPTWTLGRQRDFEPRPHPRPEPAALPWTPPAPSAAVADPSVERLRLALAESQSLDAGLKRPISGEESREADKDRGALTPLLEGKLAAPAGAPYGAAVADVEAAKQVPAQRRPEPPVVTLAAPPSPPAPSASFARFGSSRAEKPVDVVPWTDQGYRPPSLDPDSPTAAASGYLFTLYAPGRHTVRSGAAARRVPLSRQRFGVSPVHRVRPGLSLAAYLTASLENRTGQPILRGAANLFAGSMFSGRTWLNTALPGRTIVLPLGVDDAVQVARQLRQKTGTQGVVFKDDATSYTVALEIANHHRYPVQVELDDQVPVATGSKVEVRAFSSQSFGKPDQRGRVSWKGSVPAASVKKLEFSFEIVRPKDWELQQHDD